MEHGHQRRGGAGGAGSSVSAAGSWQRLQPLEKLLLEDIVPHNEPIITGTFSFSSTLSSSFILNRILRPIAAHPRFHSIVQRDAFSALNTIFVPVPNFLSADNQLLEKHLTISRKPIAPSLALSNVLSSSLDSSRPLWHVFCYPRLNLIPLNENERDDETDCDASAPGITLFFRVHHALSDGIGLMHYFLRHVVDPLSEQPPLPPAHRRSERKRKTHPLLTPVTERWRILQLVQYITRPFRDIAAMFIDPLRPDDTSVCNRAPPQKIKAASFLRRYSLQTMLTRARAVGVTLNDILLGALVSAARVFIMRHDGRLPKRIRAGVPINGHVLASGTSGNPSMDSVELMNAVAVLPLRLPLHTRGRVETLRAARGLMNDIKKGARPVFAISAFRLVACLPRSLRSKLWVRLSRCASVLFSNMPGPDQAASVAGEMWEQVAVLAPSQGHAGFTVSAISYNGGVNIGVACDRARMDPREFARILQTEIDGILEWIAEVADVSVSGASAATM